MHELLDRNDPILRQEAEAVAEEEFNSEWLKELIETLFEIMRTTGAVGVAAPQIGVSKQVIVFSTAYSKTRKPDIEIPDTALINPTINSQSEEFEDGYEGCLNGDGLMGEVPRPKEIEYSGYDVEGNPVEQKRATGLEARIVQHEIDHLRGILFFDRVQNEETIAPMEEVRERLQR